MHSPCHPQAQRRQTRPHLWELELSWQRDVADGSRPGVGNRGRGGRCSNGSYCRATLSRPSSCRCHGTGGSRARSAIGRGSRGQQRGRVDVVHARPHRCRGHHQPSRPHGPCARSLASAQLHARLTVSRARRARARVMSAGHRSLHRLRPCLPQRPVPRSPAERTRMPPLPAGRSVRLGLAQRPTTPTLIRPLAQRRTSTDLPPPSPGANVGVGHVVAPKPRHHRLRQLPPSPCSRHRVLTPPR